MKKRNFNEGEQYYVDIIPIGKQKILIEEIKKGFFGKKIYFKILSFPVQGLGMEYDSMYEFFFREKVIGDVY